MFNRLAGKDLNSGHYMQTFQPNLVTPAMLIGNIDLYHFIPLSLTLTFPGGHKVRGALPSLVNVRT